MMFLQNVPIAGQPAGVYVCQLVVGGAVRATWRLLHQTETGQ